MQKPDFLSEKASRSQFRIAPNYIHTFSIPRVWNLVSTVLPSYSNSRTHIWVSCGLAFRRREIHTWRWHTSRAESHGPFLGGTSLFRDVVDRPRRRIEEREGQMTETTVVTERLCEARVKRWCVATQIRDSHTGRTHTVDVSQVISMQSKGGVKLLGRGSLAEKCRQEGAEKWEQNVKRYCDEA